MRRVSRCIRLARAGSSTAAPRKLPPLSSSPLVHEYDRLLRDGALRPDDAQVRVVRKLARIQLVLEDYDPPPEIVKPPDVKAEAERSDAEGEPPVALETDDELRVIGRAAFLVERAQRSCHSEMDADPRAGFRTCEDQLAVAMGLRELVADEARGFVVARQLDMARILAMLGRLDRAVEAIALYPQTVAFGFGQFGHDR